MKKILFVIFIMLVLLISVYSQDNNEDELDVDTVLTANSQITEVRLSGFEDASFWNVSMPIDQGVVVKQSRRGAPNDVSDDTATNALSKRDEKYGIPRDYPREKVLGVRVQYIARGYNWFAITPTKPIIIEGICQSISVFVAGRNYRHLLKVRLLDYFGRDRELIMDKLNFIGWKELVVSIPERIEQTDYHFVDKQGLKFNGFLIKCDPMETLGTYYIYFDELRAMTDIFNETTKDIDDMTDGW
jgi:hypothetical protein